MIKQPQVNSGGDCEGGLFLEITMNLVLFGFSWRPADEIRSLIEYQTEDHKNLDDL